MKLGFNPTNLSQFGFNNVVLLIYLVGISQYTYFMLPIYLLYVTFCYFNGIKIKS